MRSTIEIIIAVKESQPVTEEELKLALCAMSGIHHHLQESLRKIIEEIRAEKPAPLLKMKADFEYGTLERLWNGIKMPADEFLGPGNTPGNPEHARRMEMGKRIYKKATGEDL